MEVGDFVPSMAALVVTLGTANANVIRPDIASMADESGLSVAAWVASTSMATVLVIIVILGCAKKQNKEPAAKATDAGDMAASNPSYTHSSGPSEELYEEADDVVDRTNSVSGEVMYQAADNIPQYKAHKFAADVPEYAAVVKRDNQPEEEDVYNVAMVRTPAPTNQYNEARDIYGNSEQIFQNVIIDASQVKLDKVLDSGQFGEVMSGSWLKADGKTINIAAKTIKGTVSAADKQAFIAEATMMSQLVHKNVLGVLAVTSEPLMLIMEKVSEKSLKAYIQQQGYSHESPMPFPTVLEFARQTAEGMSYLAEHGIVHRDIAARNMLLNVDSRTKFSCKVADFGLSKVTDSTFHTKTGDNKVPIPTRWTALEALYKGQWSAGSDAWSWAVMVWELTTHGQFPYTLIWEDKPTVDLIAKGMRLHQAELVPDELYHLLMKCWATNVERRAKFGQVVSTLNALQNRMKCYVPDAQDYEVVNVKHVESVLKSEAKKSPKNPTKMYFYLPAAPSFVKKPPNVDRSQVFYKIMPPEEEDPVFVQVSSPFAKDCIDGQKYEEMIVHSRPGKVELLKIGKDDLLPPGVHFVRQRGDEQQRLLYAPPSQSRRQSVLKSPELPVRRSKKSPAPVGKRKPYKKYSRSPGKRAEELGALSSADVFESSPDDHTYMNQAKTERSLTLTASGKSNDIVGYENLKQNPRYENPIDNAEPFPVNEKSIVQRWLGRAPVVREDAERALQGADKGAFVVRKKTPDDVHFVITMYLGRDVGQFKHYRLLASGPSPEHSVDMIDTVNGNMNFKNLWELLAYYRSHVPGVKRALPVRLGPAVPPP